MLIQIGDGYDDGVRIRLQISVKHQIYSSQIFCFRVQGYARKGFAPLVYRFFLIGLYSSRRQYHLSTSKRAAN
jgi:hypothetical protein